MAENIVVNGVTYNGVDSVEMRTTDGRLVRFYLPAVEPTYTNLFKPSEAVLNSRINSSALAAAYDGFFITNWIDVSGKTPFADTTKIYIKGANFDKASNGSLYAKLLGYRQKPSSNYTGIQAEYVGANISVTNEGNGVISISGSKLASQLHSEIKYIVMVLKVKDTAITASDVQDIVITIDEPIS